VGTKRFRGVLLSTLIIALLMAPAAFLPIYFVEADPPDPPVNIHLTWGQNDTSHTIVVTWKTTTAEAGDNVLYDTVSWGGDPENYAYSATGSYHTYSGAGGYIHDVELTGLSPDTRYYFICGGENGGWSAERSFRTAPGASTNIRLVAGGDSRSGGNWPGPRDSISRAMAEFNPSFVLFDGDFIYYWDNQTEWDNMLASMQEYWIDNDGLTIPIIPAIGNHEVYYPQPSDYDPGTHATNYYGQFYLPGNERWYSLDWGPDLHIIVLDSEVLNTGSDTWSEQLAWLESDLAAHASCTWKIVLFHRPAYASRGSLSGAQTYWVPLFDDYNVDLVISGHHHYYERTHPLENDQISPENGTIYLVAGGWGAPLYWASPQWFTAYGPTSIYHFVVIDIFGKTLHLRAVNTDGETFDELYINKGPKVSVSISPIDNSGLPNTTLNYAVTVVNTGKFTDNYTLTASDNADPSWAPSLSDNLENVQPSESRAVTLSVTIPGNATHRTEDNITVTATSQENTDVSDNASCIARAITFDVGVSISPTWQENFPGKTLAYAVTVTNAGVLVDNYTLTVSDNLDWALTLPENWLENIDPSDNRVVTLSVTIPENAIGCAEDNIIVIATSVADNTMSDNDSCIAHAVSPKAEFSLATLYKVSLDVDNWLENGSKLVAKFYTWGDDFEGENIVWSGTTPDHVVLLEDIPHPLGKAIEKVRLDLTTDDTGNVISTLSTFVVRKVDLEARFMEVPMYWAAAPPEGKVELEIEFMEIPMYWAGAPS